MRDRAHRNHRRSRQGVRRRQVRIEFDSSSARIVWLAGTFNGWEPWDTAMTAVGNGLWIRDLLLEPGRYEYCIVAEGTWLPDPRASRFVRKRFGQQVSVLVVKPIGRESRTNKRRK